MRDHLSDNEFTKCVLGQSSRSELEHLANCEECRSELDSFRRVMSSFRTAIQDRIDAGVVSQPPAVLSRPAAAGSPKWRLVLASVALVVLAFAPLLIKQKEPPQEDPNVLMDSINVHLSRTVPAPMEPMLAVIPNDESVIESGGVQ